LEDRIAPSATITSSPASISIVFSAAETATLSVVAGHYVITDGAGINPASTGGALSSGNTVFTANDLASGQTSFTIGAGAAGTVQLAAANVIPSTTTVTLNAGFLDLGGHSDAIGALNGSGTVTNNLVTYQIDNGITGLGFNNTLFAESEDNWVGNVFTAVTGGTQLLSISFQSFSALNASNLSSPFVTAALYTGSPATTLTLVPGSVNKMALNTTGGGLITVPFAAPQIVSPGQVFTAALLIDDVPLFPDFSGVFPFEADTSNSNTNSYYDISNPPGNVNTYNLATPNGPTLNGVNYPGQGSTNCCTDTTILRVNQITPAATLTVTGGGNFSGVIQDGTGQTALTVTGGSLVLSGNSSFTGATTVQAGTLEIDGTNSASPVSVSGGTLQGTGTINQLTTTGGTVSPGGTAIGTLTVSSSGGASTLGGSTYLVDVSNSGSSDELVNTANTLNLNGATLQVSAASTSSAGQKFTILGSPSFSGSNFNGLADGTILLGSNGRNYTIHYPGTIVTLTDTPAATVYVDNIWLGTTPGTDPTHDPVGGLVFGYNAFADIQSGLDHLASGGTIVIFAEASSYAGFTVNNPVTVFDINQNPLSPSVTGVLVINSPVTLNQNVVFTQAAIMPGATLLPAADLEFDGNIVTGGTPESLTINGNANNDRFEAMGNVANPLSLVNVASGTQVTLQQDVSTSTTQNYNAPVRVEDSSTATLTGTTITFGSTVQTNVRPGGLSIAGNAVFNGVVGGGGNPLPSLQVTGTTTINTTAVTTSGTQTYADVTLGADTVLSSTGANGNIAFGGTVQSVTHHSLTVATAGITTFSGAVGGGGNTLGALTTDAGGSTQLNGGSINTSGFAQSYNDNVTLGQSFTILSGIVNFNAGLTLGTNVVQVAGTLNFTNTTTLTTTIAGPTPAQVGHMLVGAGNTTYGNATLVLNYVGFTPMAGQSFDIVSNGGFGIGQFGDAPAPGPDLINGVYYLVTYSGTPGSGDFILTVAQGPVITNASSATFTVGSAGSFAVTTTGNPTATIAVAGGLPAGVTLVSNGNGTATLAGTPAPGTGGIYVVTLTASNGVQPNAVQTFTLTVNQAPAITSAGTTTFTLGTAGSFKISTTGFPAATITLSGSLPNGLIFTSNAGGSATITGIPSGVAPGTYTVTIAASNGIGSAVTQSFVITIAVGTSRYIVTAAGAGGGPQVNVYNASTGSLIASFFAFTPTFTGGVRVAVADINGDGTPDIICAAGPGGGPQVEVIDGTKLNQLQANGQIANAALISSFYAFTPTFAGGVYVGAAVSASGQREIVVGAGAGGGPQVEVIDAGKIAVQSNGQVANSALLTSFFAFTPTFAGGVRVAVGDVNGDGTLDIIAGAGPGGSPQVVVVDGTKISQVQGNGQIANTAVLTSFFAFNSDFTGGVFVAAGDVDGSGKVEIIASAGPAFLTTFPLVTVPAADGLRVSVFDSTGTQQGTFMPYPASFLGGASVGTVSIKGKVDILTGAGPTGGPEAEVFDGSSFALLDSFFAFPQSFTGGVFVAGG
jgi:autotransporter-associated beta strand protein